MDLLVSDVCWALPRRWGASQSSGLITSLRESLAPSGVEATALEDDSRA